MRTSRDQRIVFVPYDAGKNLLPAKEYGQLFVMLSATDVSRDYNYIAQVLDQKMRDFKITDYLVLIGDPIIIGILVHIAMRITGGTINVLKWDRVRYEYDAITVEVGDERFEGDYQSR
jgi:hypothetical protein